MPSENSWNEWSKHVLLELERLTDSNEKMREDFQNFKLEIINDLAKKTEIMTVRSELGLLKDEVQIVDKRVSAVEMKSAVDISALRTELNAKAGVWGALAGALPATVVLIGLAIEYFLGK